jgi:hypothetical protein
VSSFLRLARKSGVGLGALFIYSFLVTGYYRTALPIERGAVIAAVAVIPSFTVWTISKQFNKRLVKLLAEEKVAEAYVQIKFQQGSKEFYNDYDEGIRQELNDLDEKFHYQIINILSGGAIAVTAPLLMIIEFTEFGYIGLGAGIGVALIVGYTLGIASYRKMMEILDYSTRVTKATNEA